MFDFDGAKILVIGIVALVVIKPKDLPRVFRQLGQTIGKLRRMATEFQGQFMDAMREADMEQVRKDVATLGDVAKVDAGFDPIGTIRREIGGALVDKKPTPVETPAPTLADVPAEPIGAVSPASVEEEPVSAESLSRTQAFNIGTAPVAEPVSVETTTSAPPAGAPPPSEPSRSMAPANDVQKAEPLPLQAADAPLDLVARAMTDVVDEIEASRAPLMSHLIELRTRLIKSIAAFVVTFIICFFFAKDIYNALLVPYVEVVGDGARLQYTAPQEFFFTQIRVAIFAAAFLACPVIFSQIYAFVAPGLYKHERRAFLPYLFATPFFFALGAALVYFVVYPNLLHFFLAQQQAKEPGRAAIELIPKVSEYLSLIMTLIFAFGVVFQLPVVLTLLGRVGIISSTFLREKRRIAIVLVFVVSAVLTPPDLFSMLALAGPGLILYEASILSVRWIERKRAAEEAARLAAEKD